MSRRRGRNLTYSQPMRGATATASPLHWLNSPSPLDSWLSQVEDLRLFTPSPLGGQAYNPARTVWGPPARFQVGQATHPLAGRRTRLLSPVIAFKGPSRVAICIRRRVRREVMHALRHAGRRGRAGPHRRNAYSGISCRG